MTEFALLSSRPSAHDVGNQKFLDGLASACADRGQRAVLRRFWSKATHYQALPVLGRLCAIGNGPRSLVAALYAEHPYHSATARSMGQTCFGLAGGDGARYDAHFRRLLASGDIEDVAHQVLQVIRRAARQGGKLPVNYLQLLKDFAFWRGYGDKVKAQWAKDFWQAPGAAEPDSE